MRKTTDVMQEVMKINTKRDSSVEERPTLEYSENTCSNEEMHPYRQNVQMFIVGGVELCPICEMEERNRELQKEVEANILRVRAQRKMGLLNNFSIIADHTIKDASFEGYIAEDATTEAYINKHRMIDVYKSYRAGKAFNTWLFGKPGVGKSHLAMALLNNLSKKGEGKDSCLFIKVDKLMTMIRDTFDNQYQGKDSESSLVQQLIDVDYLVLDDLGAEAGKIDRQGQASDFVHRVLYAISDGRRGKSTIITTNLLNADLKKTYDEKLISRLFSDYYLIEFLNTKDHRINQIEL
ncbi:ATP-binding protein [Listeria sp. SHR_NRA_18]|uniref:ATP-binding protein n=1 Tax=Listeria sp. SHR_NRA_18 TaxID=2269046 RepID=UPI001374ECBB|nr:ATP-binding protein [Listeria sp. SHR_NRA_18]